MSRICFSESKNKCCTEICLVRSPLCLNRQNILVWRCTYTHLYNMWNLWVRGKRDSFTFYLKPFVLWNLTVHMSLNLKLDDIQPGFLNNKLVSGWKGVASKLVLSYYFLLLMDYLQLFLTSLHIIEWKFLINLNK